MGGLFGVVSKEDCVSDLFYGTDYHSHLGTTRGGLAVKNPEGFIRFIHNIENAQFRSKFEQDITQMHGTRGIGVISDYDNQPLLIRSHLGKYAIVTVGAIKNANKLVKKVFGTRIIHFTERYCSSFRNPSRIILLSIILLSDYLVCLTASLRLMLFLCGLKAVITSHVIGTIILSS